MSSGTRYLLEMLYGDQKSRRLSYLFLIGGFIVFLTGMFSGISDNPAGLVLTYLGIIILSLAHFHHWRSKRKFLILIIISIIAIPVFVLLENLFEAWGGRMSNISYLAELFNSFGALFFILALLIFPAVLLIAIIGFLWMTLKSK